MKALKWAFFMIEFSQNISWLIPVVLVCTGISGGLYFFNQSNYSKQLRIVLTILRFTALLLISLFLLDPIIKYSSTEEEKPIFIVGIDQSKSMHTDSDSSTLKSIENILTNVSERNDVQIEVLGFGNETITLDSLDFDQNATDITNYIKNVSEQYAFKNVAGHLIVSDGIVNKGLDPRYFNYSNKTAIDVIATGDTARKIDQRISNVRYNRLVYQGNNYPLKIEVQSDFMDAKTANLTVSTSSGEKQSFEVTYNGNQDYIAIDVELEADKSGLQLITVELEPNNEERNKINNKRVIPIEVIDASEKIALLYQTLTPDIGAIKRVLAIDKNLKIELFPITELSLELLTKFRLDYNVLILYQLPDLKNRTNPKLIKELFNLNLPKLFVLGENTNVEALVSLNNAISLDGKSTGMFNTSSPKINTDFSLFTLPKNGGSIVSTYPPLEVPFGEFKISGKSDCILYQKIGNVKSTMPMWVFSDFNGEKSVFVFGSGFWRWPLAEFNKTQKHVLFENLVKNSVSYLTVKKDKRKLRILTESDYKSSNEICIRAELYNDLFEAINDPEIQYELRLEDSLSYEFKFERDDKNYTLNLGKLLPGVYSYTAKTAVGAEELMQSGSFTVSEFNMELAEQRANHELLYQITKKTEGEFFTADSYKDWLNKFKEQKFSSVIYQQTNFKDLIDLKLLFALIIALLSLEWFLRKKAGSL